MTLQHLEAIVEEVGYRYDRPWISLRGLGGFYVEGYEHWFSSKRLTRREAKQLYKRLKQKFGSRVIFPESAEWDVRNNFYNTIVVQLPRSQSSQLPDEFRAQGRATAHYKKQLKYRTITPGMVAALDERAVEILKKRAEFERKKEAVDHLLSTALAPHYKGQATMTKAKGDWYDTVTHAYAGESTLEEAALNTSFFRKLDTDQQQELMRITQKLFEEVICFNKQHEAYGKRVITFRDRNRQNATTQRAYEFQAHLREDVIQSKRPMTFEEWLGLTFLFKDIEIPRFTDEDREISHVGMHYIEQGKHVKVIHTLRNPGRKHIKGYSVPVHENEAALINAVVESVQTHDPFWFSAFNAKFDLIQLRENLSGECYGVSNRQSPPTKDVAIQMFERVGITGRQVICEWLLARTGYKDLPNRKFEMVSQMALGDDGLHKSITYPEQESLERFAMGRGNLTDSAREKFQKRFGRLPGQSVQDRQDAACMILEYLVDDVEAMPRFLEETPFFRHVHAISSIFELEPTRAAYGPMTMRNVLDHYFWKKYHVDPETVFPITSATIDFQEGLKAHVEKLLEEHFPVKPQQGIHHHVAKVQLALGQLFLPLIKQGIADDPDLLARVTEFETYIGEQHDVRSRMFLEEYLLTWANEILVDFAHYDRPRRRFEEKLKTYEITTGAFAQQWHRITDELFERDLQSLRQGRITKKAYKKLEAYHDFADTYGLDEDEAKEILNIRGRMMTGKGLVMGRHNIDPDVVPAFLKQLQFQVNVFMQRHGIEPIGRSSHFFYFIKFPEGVDSPLIVADTLESVVVADKIYYPKGRWISGLPQSDDPAYNASLFEMRVFGDYIRELCRGEVQQAESHIQRELLAFPHNTDPHELVGKIKSRNTFWTYVKNQEEKFMFFEPEEFARIHEINMTEISTYSGVSKDATSGLLMYTENNEEGVAIRSTFIAPLFALDIDYDRWRTHLNERYKEMSRWKPKRKFAEEGQLGLTLVH